MNSNDQPGVESPTPSENGGAGAGFAAPSGSADTDKFFLMLFGFAAGNLFASGMFLFGYIVAKIL